MMASLAERGEGNRVEKMKEGLYKVKSRVRDLTPKVKANQFPTAEGISYLETKHLLLLSYCQSLVYYLLHKAQGLLINGHPVVHFLVEIRLFLEKKLTTASMVSSENAAVKENATNTSEKVEDLLKYRPNPDICSPAKWIRALILCGKPVRVTMYVRGPMDDFEGRPEERREVVGAESRELSQYKAKMEARARPEEKLFTPVPLTKMEKKKQST